MAPRSEIDQKLLLQLGETLERLGDEQQKYLERMAVLETEKAADKAELERRLSAIEHNINGTGDETNPGIKISLALLKQRQGDTRVATKEDKQSWQVIAGLVLSLLLGVAGLLKGFLG